MLQPVAKLLFGFTVTGFQNLPPKGAVVIACNHCSYLDPPLVAISVRRQICFLARASLFRNRLFGALIKSFGARPVSRSDAGGMKSALRLLREQNALLLFPEGTRSLDGKLQPIKSGTAWLAIYGRCPIVPVWIDGSYRALPKGGSVPKFKKIRVEIGEMIDPLEIEAVDRDALIAAVTERLSSRLQEMEQRYLLADGTQTESSTSKT